MTWFTDNPTPIFIICGIALLVLLVFLLKTGRGVILLAMVGVVLCIVTAIVIDSIVVTDREQVEQTLFQAAALAEENKLEELLDLFISPSVPHIRGQARSWIAQASRIDDVSVSAIDITVNHKKNPSTARAEFRVYARGEARERNNPFPFQYMTRMRVDFQREGDRWRVIDYQRGL
jgi:hypothetical protein